MNNNIANLLFYPFEKEALDYPDKDSKTLFVNTEYFSLAKSLNNIQTLQFFYPYALGWSSYDVKIINSFPDNGLYQNIFCTLPKQKEAAHSIMANALNCLELGGLFVAVATNDAGGKKIESWLKDFGVEVYSLSKSKSRIVWAYNINPSKEKINTAIQNGSVQAITVDGESFLTQPGIFGWNKIDKGSNLLIDNIDHNFKGMGADFGCGYGYLISQILKNNADIDKIYALDADYNALACAKKNLSNFATSTQIEYRWTDLTQHQKELSNLDWIVMNPPFHEGKKADHSIGIDFIHGAANALKTGGFLYMVANAHLPYEKILAKKFTKVIKIYEDQGYKIYSAQK